MIVLVDKIAHARLAVARASKQCMDYVYNYQTRDAAEVLDFWTERLLVAKNYHTFPNGNIGLYSVLGPASSPLKG